MPYLDLPQGSIWYEEQGSGDPLVLLHGGAVDSRFFEHNVGPLAEHFRVIATDLWGHGRTADREGPFSLESFSTDVAALIEQVGEGSAHVLGHSIGAAVALDLTMRRPELVRQLIEISGGYDVAADASGGEIDIDAMVAETVKFLGSSYGAVSPDGEEHFAIVTRKDFELSSREPRFTPEQVGQITHRTLVMVADDDITPISHQIDFYGALQQAELAVVPGTSHFLLQEKPALCNAIILDFLTNEPVPTVAPIRRAAPPTPA
ncbi:MAG TPA: alpha/beta hydrolase [Candidatus Limnocylindrales bacterium]|nr:alpha/beta hydrolase [Candidatus Limnocylindrales bacterium]